jgi:hypothetical protein
VSKKVQDQQPKPKLLGELANYLKVEVQAGGLTCGVSFDVSGDQVIF